MFTKMIEYGHKIEEKMKAIQSEIKENVQGMKSDSKESGDSTKWCGPEGRKKHSTRTE